MSEADKKKLFIAIGLLVVAGGLFAWFMFGSKGGGEVITDPAAPVVQTKDGPPAAANRRMPPGAK